MSEINARLITKKSSAAGEVPFPGDLVEGELAVNTGDRYLYTKDSQGNIVRLLGPDLGSVQWSPAPKLGTNGPIALTTTNTLAIDYPPNILADQLLVLVLRTFDGQTWGDPVVDEGFELVGSYLNVAPEAAEGAGSLIVYRKVADGSETGSISLGYNGDGTNNIGTAQQAAGFMFCVENTSGISAVDIDTDDGTTLTYTSSDLYGATNNLVAFVSAWTFGDSNYWENVVGTEIDLDNSKLGAMVGIAGQEFNNDVIHRVDISTTTHTQNHSGIAIIFEPVSDVQINQDVSSVNGQIGDVKLKVEQLDDVQPQTFYGLWASEVGVSPTADGEFYPDGTTLQIAKNEANGQPKGAILSALGAGTTFWISTDGTTWATRTASAAIDGGDYIELTLDASWAPDSGELYLSEVDPSLQGKSNGDVLIWNQYTNAWETGKPEDAIKTIDDLTDVDTTTASPAVNEVLQWNGSQWVPGSGAANNSVVSVNGQTGAVSLDLEDISNVSDEGHLYTWKFVDYVPLPGYPKLQHSWSVLDANTLRFSSYGINDNAPYPFASTAGQMQGGDSFWVSETPLGPWTPLVLTTAPNDVDIPGVMAFTSTTAHGLTGGQETVYIALSDPSVITNLTLEDGSPLTWEDSTQQWVPSKPVPRNIPDLTDVNFTRNPSTDDIIRWNGLERQWELSTASKIRRYVLYRSDGGNNDVCMIGPGLKGNGLRSSRAVDRTNSAAYEDQRPLPIYPGETIQFDLSALTFLDINGEYPGGIIYVWGPQGAQMNHDCYHYDEESRVLTFEVPIYQSSYGQHRYVMAVGTGSYSVYGDDIYAAFSMWPVTPNLPTMSPRSWFRINMNNLLLRAGEDDSWDGQSYIEVDLGADGPTWGAGPGGAVGQIIDICSDHTYHFGRNTVLDGDLFYPDGLPHKIGVWPAQGYIELRIRQPRIMGSDRVFDMNNARNCSTGHTMSQFESGNADLRSSNYMYPMYQATAETICDPDPNNTNTPLDLATLKDYTLTRVNQSLNLEYFSSNNHGPAWVCRNLVSNTYELPDFMTFTHWIQSGTYGNQDIRMNRQMGY